MQAASVPVLPVDRHRSFIALLALLAGALLSTATALAMDSMDQPVLMWASGMEACRPKESLPNITSMSGRISTLKGDLNLGEYIARLRR